MKIFQEDNKLTLDRKLIIGNLVLSIFILITVLFLVGSRSIMNYQLKKDETVVSGESISDFCKFTFKNIINEKFSSLSLDKVVFNYLINDPDAFEFKEDEEVKDVRTGTDQCRVITSNSEGVRGFLLTLDSNIQNPLYYRVIGINEEEEDPTTQAKGNL